MRYLLDTHTVLWSIGQSHRLSATALDIIRDRTNEIAVSAVSLWEISLKYGIGKLVLGSMTPDDIPAHCESLGLRIVQLDPEDASTYHTFPRAVDHRDPFDRMLVHQCIHMRAILVTRDARLACYEPHGLVRAW